MSFDYHRHYDDMMRQAYRDAESPLPHSKMSEHVKSAAKSARDAVDALGRASVAFGAPVVANEFAVSDDPIGLLMELKDCAEDVAREPVTWVAVGRDVMACLMRAHSVMGAVGDWSTDENFRAESRSEVSRQAGIDVEMDSAAIPSSVVFHSRRMRVPVAPCPDGTYPRPSAAHPARHTVSVNISGTALPDAPAAAALGRTLQVIADDAAPSLGGPLALTPVEWTPIATSPKPPEPEPKRLTLPDGHTIGDVFADGEPVDATGIFNAPVGTVFCVDLGHGLIAVTRSCQYDLRDVWRHPQTRWGKVALLAQRAGEGHDVRIISHVATPEPGPAAPAPRMCGMVTPADVVATRDASPIGSDPMRFGWSSYE